ncbi:class I SAM-dependent methyltransferase [Shewanella sp. SNU WT4]|uniref:class I SAM-dependent methyltransferase n=1 Tax=Shewanella sp. SNU WT4 TaxID=2590015 RepID=UPI00112B1E28|nr:class I SAM-dependent methyltransferase [Shewanella sp. SNU WT4]QDF68409.1 class I SAM-dependent methyltransferase [Shewanella sp. SNU WT4]
MLCPLCGGQHLTLFCQDARRRYVCCQECELVSVPASFHLSPSAEKAEYDKHDNSSADAGYRRFLSRTWAPLLARLQGTHADITRLQGLDFGCGEGAVLSQMARENGVAIANYDLYYHNHGALLHQQYDFITLTEVIEHIADAAQLLAQLNTMLKAGGVLAVMTKQVTSADAFSRWHYKNDLTHINFYSDASFGWLAKHYGWQLELIDNDVVFLTKAR